MKLHLSVFVILSAIVAMSLGLMVACGDDDDDDDDDTAGDDDTGADDDDTGDDTGDDDDSGCADAMDELYNTCELVLMDAEGNELSIDDAIAACEAGDAVAACAQGCVEVSATCDEVVTCFNDNC